MEIDNFFFNEVTFTAGGILVLYRSSAIPYAEGKGLVNR